MASNQFLPFATGGSANVTDQTTYAAASTTTNGFQSGLAKSADVNKVLRQASFVAAAIAQFIADNQSNNVNDDGNIANFESYFKTAMRSLGIGGNFAAYANVSASRAIGTTYTNTTGRPLHVLVTIQTPAAANNGVRFYVAGAEVSQFYAQNSLAVFGYVGGIVPPGATYQVANVTGSSSLSIWQEL